MSGIVFCGGKKANAKQTKNNKLTARPLFYLLMIRSHEKEHACVVQFGIFIVMNNAHHAKFN
jgi:hypothetical protein